MTGLGASAATLALMCAVAIGAGALAQPRQLVPGRGAPAAPPPAAAAADTAAPAPAPTAPAADDEGVQVTPLAPPSPDAIGLLDGSSGALGPQLWRGSDRGAIGALLDAMPPALRLHTLRNLVVRALLTPADPPPGPAPASFLVQRAQRVFALGDPASAAQLARFAESGAPTLPRLRTDAAWLLGDQALACATVAERLRADPDPYWVKASIFCRLLAGDGAGANLALALWQEQNPRDASFAPVATALVRPGARLELAGPVDPLTAAMLRQARLLPPVEALRGANPAVVAALATGAGGDADARLALAERAEAEGALSADALAQFYLGLTLSAEERRADDAALRRPDRSAARTAALLVQNAAASLEPAVRGPAITRAMNWAAERNQVVQMGRILAPMARTLQPTAEGVAHAAAATRALLAGGDREQAAAWLAIARAAPAAAELAPLWWLFEDGRIDAAEWDRWTRHLTQRAPDQRARRITTVLALAEALGGSVPPNAWRDGLSARPEAERDTGAPAALQVLPRAAGAGRVGEAVLLAALAIGEGSGVVPSLAGAVGALRQVGLTEDARALALEAALARGV